jgi:hypothetical protein
MVCLSGRRQGRRGLPERVPDGGLSRGDHPPDDAECTMQRPSRDCGRDLRHEMSGRTVCSGSRLARGPAGRPGGLVRGHRPERVLLQGEHVLRNDPIRPFSWRGLTVELFIG